jgi:HEAT repeat protein
MSATQLFILSIPISFLAGMFAFIFGRRALRARTLRRLDRWREHWLSCLPELMDGKIPEDGVLAIPEAREALETLLVDRLQAAASKSRKKRISALIERSGVLDHCIHKLRAGSRWERVCSASLLGRIGSALGVAPLIEALQDDWPPMRQAVVRSLGAIGSPAAGPALLKMLPRGDTVEPYLWVEAAVACTEDREAFVELIDDLEPEKRRLLAQAIAESRAPIRVESLERLVRDPDPEIRAKAARALGLSGNARALPLLISAVNDPEWFVRLRAVGGLSDLKLPAGLTAVLYATRDDDPRVRQKASSALMELVSDPAEVLDQLLFSHNRPALAGFFVELARTGLLWNSLPLLRDLRPHVRRKSADLLAKAVATGNYEEILYAVEVHPDWRIRMAAARLVALAGDRSLAPEVERRMLTAPTPRLRRVWKAILGSLESPSRDKRRVMAIAV